ncbi:ABC transporter substrate-binding protein [Mangrovibrevibacter kandeliae]|uniref:ABC transporter substrate-binding protein n=1 Tax=Mangrovibrevibacter kandeliae TaxID=2968473 RepID=UPI00211847D2|nr:ABC transporter substrate-binding protein [Aurantimonas sp. CSK15Z-1]MCQ8782094.1 ABC transporter substrate-binding protein [Aurantimonas sp. CSK15Z-1]
MKIANTLLIALSLAGALAAAPQSAAAETLTVGAYPANPPWEVKKEDGSFEGFEVDLVKEIAKRLGDEVDIQDLGFQALFAATASRRIDLAISTISITNDRLKNQSFTQGYYDSDLALVTQVGSEVKTLEDLKGKTVGALSTSTGETWIKDNQEKYGFGEYKGYDTFQNLLLDVQNGRVAGGISDIGGFQYAMKQLPQLSIAERIQTGDRFAMMLPKNSPLLEKVNDAISAIKKDGTMAKLHEKWLGVPADPGTSTVEVLPIPTAE